MKSHPQFAVIGRVNKGKSSIVSTLAEDDSVQIESAAGTTKVCQEFPIRIDGRTVITLIDTPGFQQAPRALAWLNAHQVSAADRRAVVQQFLTTFKNSDDFVDECRLLQPIMDGAGILYVVDGARPFRRNYEAEMEILRWTGQPRMALINYIGETDFSGEWKQALDQYFSVVRQFNAQKVSFEDRILLLQAFRELHEDWREPVEQSIQFLQDEWQRRQRFAAHRIAEMLVEELTYYHELTLEPYEKVEDYRSDLEVKFHEHLRKREQKARSDIEKIYQHVLINKQEKEIAKPIFNQDLFAESTWDMLGLSAVQLLGLGAVGGAVAGGALDAVVGGSSFMAGAITGALLGAGSVFYFSTNRFASIEAIGSYLQGKNIVRIGPHKNKNFPWILLDRALLHYFSVRDWAHSRRETLVLQNDSGYVGDLRQSTKRELTQIFSTLTKKAGKNTQEAQIRLGEIIGELLLHNSKKLNEAYQKD
ncbi:GTPase/DUF3482 domain-containing protein [candidate division KSB1 bacterium]|nr:GTPase/DUF3482 domain-containing protein [candidate division KSB1 bacterium]